ncbi:MAG: response regulator, partial [Verrucomicrobia bacterium]|nr:response regulator [Verrucomicrobiota bacterium]
MEDDKLLSRRVGAYLESRGAEVMQAQALSEARNLLGDFSFDVALSDVHLPDGNSLDLLKQGAYPDTCRVLVMTAEGGVEIAVEAMRLGAVDFLAKPFELDELPLIILRSRKQQKQDRLESF